MQTNLWVNDKVAMSTQEIDTLKEIKVYINMTITNESLVQAAAEENVDFFKNPKVI
jgi:hypothetical protein